jgi:hypothetical protein
MFFFKPFMRPRSRRSPAAVRTRLNVEQLEVRAVPTCCLPHNELLVNTNTTGSHQTSASGGQAVATDTAGDFVVVYSGQGQNGPGSTGIYAQRYAVTGTRLGSEIQVNTYTKGTVTDPAIAMDAAGDFIVTWSAYGEDGSGWGVYGQRYNSLGVAQGGEFQVNTYTSGDQNDARVGMDAVGNFTIVWSSSSEDGSGWGVYAQRYNSSGVAQGSEFRINTTTAGDQEYVSIAMNGTGSFVVSWSSNGQDGSGWGVFAQRCNASGVEQGREFQVNTYTKGDQMYSSVGIDPAGDFVITWSSNGEDGSGWGTYAQRYSSSGVAQGGEFLVNTYTTGDQMYSTVAMDANGNFTITWSSNGQDGGGWGVYAQQFTSAGAKSGSETRVNTTTAGDQQYSSIAMTATGQAVIVWSGNGVGDSSGVFAQQWQLL